MSYRTIDSRFWSDPKVRALSPESKLLFLYLITNEHANLAGIYHLPAVLIPHETGLAGYPIDTLSIPHLAQYDDENEVVWVRNVPDTSARRAAIRYAANLDLAGGANTAAGWPSRSSDERWRELEIDSF